MWYDRMHDWGYGDMAGWGDAGGWWGMGLHAVLPILFWTLVITLVVVAVRALWRVGSARQGDGETPRAILEARYARGEIDGEEFLRRKKDLT